MGKGRLEAFSDGVLAIIITIMVLELRPPHETDWNALLHLLPVMVSYILSFIFVGIYWNNHHHLLMLVQKITGPILWANLHLLFWLSLVPFVTAWIGEHPHASLPLAAYGVVLLGAGVAFYILCQCLVSVHGKESTIAKAFGRDAKGVASVAIYAVAVPVAFVLPWLSYSLYVLVALLWLVPDKRVENIITKKA
ncbi:MAG: TMEM175 family protein [Bacteriovoracia bacterium]